MQSGSATVCSAVAGSLPEAAGLSISAKEYAAKVRLHADQPPHFQTICLAVDFKRCAQALAAAGCLAR
jgi:hypothetical protein